MANVKETGSAFFVRDRVLYVFVGSFSVGNAGYRWLRDGFTARADTAMLLLDVLTIVLIAALVIRAPSRLSASRSVVAMLLGIGSAVGLRLLLHKLMGRA